MAEGSTADTSVKFMQINREVGVVTYGLAVPGYRSITRLVEEVNRTAANRPAATGSIPERRVVYFSDILKEAQKIFLEDFQEFLKELKKTIPGIDSNDKRFLVGFVLAGYDTNESNQFKIVNAEAPEFKLDHREDVIAGQWPVSQYLTNVMYFPEMDVEHLKRFAVFLLVETETVSSAVGGPLQVATVTLENGFQRLSEQEVRNLIRENQFRFADFRHKLMSLLC